MIFKEKLFVCLLIIVLSACSADYKELSSMKVTKKANFQNYILNEYKAKATFEAKEMHDWNTAKLYSQKALKSLKTDNIYPEKITYWKLPKDKIKEIKTAHENLLDVYKDGKINDPYNLAKAISSLDCWSEQQEENWQIWDINQCKEDFFKSMHLIYEKNLNNQKNINSNNNLNEETLNKKLSNLVSENQSDVIMEIIYFDFDKAELSNLSKNKIISFLNENKQEINKYLVIGHTDTKGTKKYNLLLSIKRAKIVQKVLIDNGINEKKINILGAGEESLAIITPDNTKQPANRRVEIKKIN